MWKSEDAALFAPDYDDMVAPELVDTAMLRLQPAMSELLLLCDRHGILPITSERVHVRDLILHGLAEIFAPQLTPLGLAVRDRITSKGK